MNKLVELWDKYIQFCNTGWCPTDADFMKRVQEQRLSMEAEIKSEIQKIADSLPKLPVGQKVIVDGKSVGTIVEYAYVIEWDGRPSDFSTFTEDDGVEPL